MRSEKTIAQIRSQIIALEFAFQRAMQNNEPQQKLFALNGKIKNLKKELDEAKNSEWLAR
jgi:hypothetical protein